MHRQLNTSDLKKIKYPYEDILFYVALTVCIPVAIAGFVLIFVSNGMLAFLVLIVIALLWLMNALLKAYLIANSIRVSNHNFPEINQVVLEVKERLGYEKKVDVFIVEDGNINAFLANFFKIKMIILNSSLVEDMLAGKKILQLKWIIGRFVGAMKAKQMRLDLFKIILDGIEQLRIFNLLILPYERAIQYSGDNIGFIVSEDLEETMSAFDKFLVGNSLSKKVNVIGVLEQGEEVKRSHLASLVRLLSPFPHVIDRYLNLLSFAKKYYPKKYRVYLDNKGLRYARHIERIIPNYYELHDPDISVNDQPPNAVIQVHPDSRQGKARSKIKINRR